MSKMSYRNKPYRDKRNLALAESERLRQDIEELEDALILHSRFQSKDENSVRGMIRKEIGGSRWEHGGEGRLTTYRSERDLGEQTSRELGGRHGGGQTRRKPQKVTSRGDMGNSSRGVVNTGQGSKRGKSGAGTLREIMDNKKQLEKQRKTMSFTSTKDDSLIEQPDLEVTCIKAEWGQVEREESPLRRDRSPVEDRNGSKTRTKILGASQNMDINDLKNKVLAKASSKVIDRKTFSAKSNLDSRSELQLSGRSHYDPRSRKKQTAGSHIVTQRGDGDPGSCKYLNLNVLDTTSYALYKTTGAKSKQDGHSHKSNESLNTQIHKQNVDKDCLERNKDFIFRENKYDSQSKLKSQTSRDVDDDFQSEKWADSRETSLPPKEFHFQKFQRRNSYSSDTHKNMTTSDSLEKPQRKSIPSTAVALISQPPKASLTSSSSQQGHIASNSFKGFNQTSKSSNVSASKDLESVQSPTKITGIFITNPTHPEPIGIAGSTLPTSPHASAFSARSLYNSTISSMLYNTDTFQSSSNLTPGHSNQQQSSSTKPKQRTTHVIQQSTAVDGIPAVQPSSDAEPVQLRSIKSKEDTEVEAWLHNLCLQSVDHYTKLFSDHQMDMASIKLLTADGLRDMGINALGPIMKIMKGVQILNRDERSPDRNTCRRSFERAGEKTDMVDSSEENDNIQKGMLDLISPSGYERKYDESKNREICNLTSKVDDNEKEYKTMGRNDQKKSSGGPGLNSKTKTQMSLSKLTGWKQTSEDADYANLKDRSPVSDVNVPENFVVKEKSKQKKKSGQPVKRSMSAKVRGKNAGLKVIGKPPAVSKNVEDGILTAAEKFSNKLQQQRLKQEAEERSAARQKQMRDEMAAKHIRRRSSSLDRNIQKGDTDRSHRSSLERSASFTMNNGAFEMSPRDTSRSAGVESVLSTRALPVKKKTKGANRLSEKQQLDKASQNAINEMDEIIASLKSTSESQNPEVRKSRSENQDLTLGAVRDMQKQLSHIEQQLIQGVGESQQDLNQRESSGSAGLYSEEDSSPRHSARGRKSARERRRHRAAMGWGPDEEKEGLALSASFSVPDSNRDISMPTQQSLSASESVNRQSSRSTELSMVNPSLPSASSVSGADGSMQGSSRSTRGANVRSSIDGTEQKTRRNNEIGKAAVTMTTTATTTEPHVNKLVEFDFSPLRDQNRKDQMQSLRQSVRPSKGNLGAIYHIENLKKVELDRTDISFSEKDLLGDGAFSQVFKGTYQGSEVAVKRLKTPLQTIDKNYFIAEVSMLQELRHPHVVMLMGLCSTDNLPLMILEFLACGNLHTLLHDSDRSALDSKDFCQIAHDVSAGMMYLHKHKPPVLHLDLKPRNVLIGHGMRAKVADFGFSKLKHEADMKVSRASKSRIVQGTPAWMAPELLAAGEITAKADVYSFGVVLWEMLTRKVPYEGCTVFQVLEMVRVNRRPSVPPDCPGSLSQLIQKCWDQNPAARPAFKEVIKSLELLSESTGWTIPVDSNVTHEDPVMSIDLSHHNSPLLNNTTKTPRSVRRPERSQRSEWVQLELESFSSHGGESDDESSDNSTDNKSEDSLSPKNRKQATPTTISIGSHGAKSDLRPNGKEIQDNGSSKTVEIPTGTSCNRHTPSPRQSISSLIKEGQDPAQELIAKYLPNAKSHNSVSKSHDSQPVLPAHGKLLPLRCSVDRPKAHVSLKHELNPFDQQTAEKNENQNDHVTNYTKDNHVSQIRFSNDTFRKSSKLQSEIANRESLNNSLQLTMGMHNSYPDAQSYTPSFHPTRSEDLNLGDSRTASIDVPVHQKDRCVTSGFIPSSGGTDPTSSFMKSLNKAHSSSASVLGLRKQADRESKAHNMQNVSSVDKNCYMERHVLKSLGNANKEKSVVTLKMDSQKSSVGDAKAPNSTSGSLSEIERNDLSLKKVENIENPSDWSERESFSEPQVLSQSVENPANNGDSQNICEQPNNEFQMSHPPRSNITLNAEQTTKSDEEPQINAQNFVKQNKSSLNQLSLKVDSPRSKNKTNYIPEKPKYTTTIESVPESVQAFSSVSVTKYEMSNTVASCSKEANSNSDSESSTIPDDISEDSLSHGKDDDFTDIKTKETPSASADDGNITKSKDWLEETSSFEIKDLSLSTCKPDDETTNRNRESFFLFDTSDVVEPVSLTQSTSVWNIENTTSLNQGSEFSSSSNQPPLQIVPNQKARNARRNTSADGQSASSLHTQTITANKPAMSLTEAMHQELLLKTRSAAENSESSVKKKLKFGMSDQESRLSKTGNQYKPSLSPNKPSHSIKSVPSSQATHPKETKFFVTDSLLAKGRKLLKPAEDPLPLHNVKPNSTGVASFAVEASMLVERKGQLRSVTTREPPPIWKVAEDTEEENLPSMASILKKAMTDRRFAMGDNHESADLTPEASWSIQEEDH